MTAIQDPAQFDAVVRKLAATPAFMQASRIDLQRLVASAECKTVAAGNAICEAADPNDPSAPLASTFYFLVDGEFTLQGGVMAHGFLEGVVGIEDVLAECPRSITVTAIRDGLYLEFSAGAFRALRTTSTPLRQALYPHMKGLATSDEYITPVEGDGLGNVVQFLSGIIGLPLSLLIQLLGRAIASSFPDCVVIARPGAPTEPMTETEVPGYGPGRLVLATVPSNDIGPLREKYDYVFLDGLTTPSADIVVNLIFGYEDEYVPPAPIGTPWVLRAVVVGKPPLPCGKILRSVDANPSLNTSTSSCRVLLDLLELKALAQSWNPLMPNVPIDAELEREMASFARALTRRQTGIALAGGGVWSMQSVYILRELVRRKVPIDIITGASAGAMIGGYYSVLGLEGLERLVELGDKGALDALVVLWATSGYFAEAFFDREFGEDTCLENLSVHFHPNATNLTTGLGVAFTRGPVGTAVRAAASAPPMVQPTINNRQRYVDGAFSNNVAVQVLPYFGAELTYAANTYPTSRRPSPWWVPECVMQMASWGPLNRALDFTVAINVLANLTGKVESSLADVAFNAATPVNAPYLFTTNFCISSQVIEAAKNNEQLHKSIDQFEREWIHLKMRGKKGLTLTPCDSPLTYP